MSETLGPITSLDMLMAQAAYFKLQPIEALRVLAEVHAAVRDWRAVALGADVGLPASQLEDFARAFEHREMETAKELVR